MIKFSSMDVFYCYFLSYLFKAISWEFDNIRWWYFFVSKWCSVESLSKFHVWNIRVNNIYLKKVTKKMKNVNLRYHQLSRSIKHVFWGYIDRLEGWIMINFEEMNATFRRTFSKPCCKTFFKLFRFCWGIILEFSVKIRLWYLFEWCRIEILPKSRVSNICSNSYFKIIFKN